MSTFERFEDIEAWKTARELTREIYSMSRQAPFSRDFELRGQIRKASTSILSNIAEGFERDARKEFIHFLSIAKGSAGEVRSCLYVALDQGYLAVDEFDRLRGLAVSASRQIGGLVKYLRRVQAEATAHRGGQAKTRRTG